MLGLRRHHLARLGRAVLTSVALANPVAAVALLVQQRWAPLATLDTSLVGHATDLTRAHPALRSALVVWQEVWQPWRAYLGATAVCAWTWRARGLASRSLWAWITLMLGWNVYLDAKLLVRRARPVVEDPVATAPGYSFPSGHAANTASIALVLVILLWPLLRTRAARVTAATAAGLVTVSVLADRVLLGVHYPSDVVAGALLAGAFVGGSWWGFVGMPARRERGGPTLLR